MSVALDKIVTVETVLNEDGSYCYSVFKLRHAA